MFLSFILLNPFFLPEHIIVPNTMACLAWPDGYQPGVYSDKYYLVETAGKDQRLSETLCDHADIYTRLAMYKTEDEAKELVDLVNGIYL